MKNTQWALRRPHTEVVCFKDGETTNNVTQEYPVYRACDMHAAKTNRCHGWSTVYFSYVLRVRLCFRCFYLMGYASPPKS